MSTDKRSADFSFDEFYREQMEQFQRDFDRESELAVQRRRRNANVERRIELSEAQLAQRRREAQTDETIRRQRLSQNQGQFEQRMKARDTQQQGISERFAQTQAQREQARQDRERRYSEQAAQRQAQIDARNQRRAQAEAQRARRPAGFTTGTPGIGGGPSKESVAKFIIFATAIAAGVSLLSDLNKNPNPTTLTTPQGDVIKIPAHLHAFGGVFVAGTVALIVNEIYPAAGLLLGVGIVTIVILAPTNTNAISRIGGSLFGGVGHVTTIPNAPVPKQPAKHP